MPRHDPREALGRLVRGRVGDARVVAAVRDTPRDRYVPASRADQAWNDCALAIGEGQTISQPTLVAQMTEALAVGPGDTVLDVGTGSGYQAAILSRLAGRVFGIELLRRLARRARRALDADPGATAPVHLVVADAWRGFPGRIRFDAILVAAAPVQVPPPLLDQLRPGGRLVAPVGAPGAVQELLRIERRPDGGLEEQLLGLCAFVPLVGTPGDEVARKRG